MKTNQCSQEACEEGKVLTLPSVSPLKAANGVEQQVGRASRCLETLLGSLFEFANFEFTNRLPYLFTLTGHC